jgi:hypothetical protein
VSHQLPAREDWIRIPTAGDKSGLYTTVKASGDGRLSVAVPTDGVREHSLDEGTKVVVEWTTPRGVMRADGYVARPVDVGVPALLLDLGEPEVIQRRQDVRADVAVEFVLSCTSVPLAKGTTIDLSGGGMLAALPDTAIERGETTEVSLQLPDGEPLVMVARVLRVVGDGRYGFIFENLAAKDRERLIKFVFASHRQNYVPRNRRP